MGSATTQALAASVTALDAQQLDLDAARDLFAAAQAIGGSTQLSGALSDSAAPVAAREQVVKAVFGAALGAPAVNVLTTVAGQRWSDAADLVDGITELATRAAAKAEPNTDVEGELFSFSRTVAANPELELALNGSLGQASAKSTLAEKLLASAAPATRLIVSSLVQKTRDRRVRQLLDGAMKTVAAQRGRTVATVVTAAPLTDGQASRLQTALSAKYGTQVSLNTVVDPTVVGGLRVQIADDVIDGSISSRLADVRQKLVGTH
ncbi:F0F1 ATP synthase subunit delta [Microbacterium gorillae]|uniref:F0F1 ATP synthase subunit delta n=1 Tax=Microbacterium gorillae TaxID=1231063 RepID=UPI00058CB581|nr:F0F1 ATP synthase subunit delta [Microbacterium gorillae]